MLGKRWEGFFLGEWRFSPEVEESPHISQCPLCNLLEKAKCCDCKEHKKITTLESLLTSFFFLLGTLLGLMHSTQLSEVKLKTDVLDALLKVFDLDPRTRAVFREVGGFVYVMSVLINMEGSLADPVNPAWTDGTWHNL